MITIHVKSCSFGSKPREVGLFLGIDKILFVIYIIIRKICENSAALLVLKNGAFLRLSYLKIGAFWTRG